MNVALLWMSLSAVHVSALDEVLKAVNRFYKRKEMQKLAADHGLDGENQVYITLQLSTHVLHELNDIQQCLKCLGSVITEHKFQFTVQKISSQLHTFTGREQGWCKYWTCVLNNGKANCS